MLITFSDVSVKILGSNYELSLHSNTSYVKRKFIQFIHRSTKLYFMHGQLGRFITRKFAIIRKRILICLVND